MHTDALRDTLTVADQGFPVRGMDLSGGHVNPLEGHGPLMWALFGKNVCENERIGSHRGACAWHTP